MERFSNFLINEEKSYLGHRVGDVLVSLQDLQGDLENMGTRQLSRYAEEVVNQIRKILHSRWSPKYQNQLKELQKIGVAIQKTIDERGDLKQLLPAAVKSLESLSGRLGVKINNLKAPEVSDDSDLTPQDFQSTGEQPDFKKKPESQQPTPELNQSDQNSLQNPAMEGQPPAISNSQANLELPSL